MKKVIISIAALMGCVSVEHHAMSMMSKDRTMQLPPVPVATKSVSVPEQPQALERSTSEEIFDLEDIDQYSLPRDRQSVWSEVESQSINQPYTQDSAASMVDEKRAAEEPQSSSNPYNLSLAAPSVPLSVPAMADEGVLVDVNEINKLLQPLPLRSRVSAVAAAQVQRQGKEEIRKRKTRFASLAEDAMQPAHDEYNIPAFSVPARQRASAANSQQKSKKRTFTASQMAEDSSVKQPKTKKSRKEMIKAATSSSDYHFDLTNEEGLEALTYCMAQMEKKWPQFKKKEPEILTSFAAYKDVLQAFTTCVLKKQYDPGSKVPVNTGRVWSSVGEAVAESLKNKTLTKRNLGKNMSALRTLFREILGIFEAEYKKGLFAEVSANSAPEKALLKSAIKTIQKATGIDGDPKGKEVKWRTSSTVAQAINNTAAAAKRRADTKEKYEALPQDEKMKMNFQNSARKKEKRATAKEKAREQRFLSDRAAQMPEQLEMLVPSASEDFLSAVDHEDSFAAQEIIHDDMPLQGGKYRPSISIKKSVQKSPIDQIIDASECPESAKQIMRRELALVEELENASDDIIAGVIEELKGFVQFSPGTLTQQGLVKYVVTEFIRKMHSNTSVGAEESELMNLPDTQFSAVSMRDEKVAAEKSQSSSNPYNLSLAAVNVPLSAPAMADKGEGLLSDPSKLLQPLPVVTKKQSKKITHDEKHTEEIVSTTRTRKTRFASLAEDAMQPAHDEYNIPAAKYFFGVSDEEGPGLIAEIMHEIENTVFPKLQKRIEWREVFTRFNAYKGFVREFVNCVLVKNPDTHKTKSRTNRLWESVGKEVKTDLDSGVLTKKNCGKDMSAFATLIKYVLLLINEKCTKAQLFIETSHNFWPAKNIQQLAIEWIKKETGLNGDPNGIVIKDRAGATTTQDGRRFERPVYKKSSSTSSAQEQSVKQTGRRKASPHTESFEQAVDLAAHVPSVPPQLLALLAMQASAPVPLLSASTVVPQAPLQVPNVPSLAAMQMMSLVSNLKQ